MRCPKLKKIRGVIFDYGGTLDTNGRHWAHVLWDGYCFADVSVSEDQFREAYVYGERALGRERIIQPGDNYHTLLLKKVHQEFQFLLKAGFLSFSDTECLKNERMIADFCYAEVQRVLSISRQVLDILYQKFPLVLVSNFYGNMQAVLQDFKLENYFKNIVESAVVGVRKPNPNIFRLGIDALQLPPGEVCVVGDSYEKDILPAMSLGCHTVWFKGEEWKPSEHDDIVADTIITEIVQLPDVFW
ncbi:MAG: HAD family hydrolase [Bacteroidaceae bacterium]|jgi:putative hydrolase of the HAD superfamily|nr:HAD family hydrolase [Bacteroidaceae bacterium]